MVPPVISAFTNSPIHPLPSRVTPNMNPPSETDAQNGTSGPSSKPSLFPVPQRDWSNMTRTIAHYERIEQIGEGTYGQVYRARCKDTNQIVALKKIRVHHGGYWGMPPTVIREIKILKRLRHPNLVKMVEVVSSKGVEHLDEDDEVEEKHKLSKKDRIVDAREGFKGNLFLVLEYVSHDLTGLMDVAYRFSEVQVKCIFRQLLEALEYMHNEKYVHRDIKSSNILIDHNFRVKLADFGLARCIEPPILDKIHDRHNSQEFTNKVITLWYRPPELLLGATRYGPAVDIWSAGCILAELVLGKPMFTGKTEMDQLHLIFEMLGTPTSETWDGFQDLKLLRTGAVKIDVKRKAKLRDKYHSKISGPALNLVEKLLELDPQKRLTASRALNSRYFLSEPKAPDRPEDLGPLLVEGGHFHEFQTKKKRREAKQIAEKSRQAALEVGKSEKEAQAEFDAMYREIMEKVAREGLNAGPKIEKRDSEKHTRTASEEKARREKSERKRSSRDKDRDSSRREQRSSRDARKEERRRESRESREKGRDKERSSRRKSDAEDSEKRRKRRRGEGEVEAENRREDGDGTTKREAVELETPAGVRSADKANTEGDASTLKNRKDETSGPSSKFSPAVNPGGGGAAAPPRLAGPPVDENGTNFPTRPADLLEVEGVVSRSSRRRRDRSRSRDRSRDRSDERKLERKERRESSRQRDRYEYDRRLGDEYEERERERERRRQRERRDRPSDRFDRRSEYDRDRNDEFGSDSRGDFRGRDDRRDNWGHRPGDHRRARSPVRREDEGPNARFDRERNRGERGSGRDSERGAGRNSGRDRDRLRYR